MEKFISVTGCRLHIFSASLHLEYINEISFLEKCLWFLKTSRDIHNGEIPFSFVVTCVASIPNLPRLLYLKNFFEHHGIRFKVQPLKFEGDIVRYTQMDRDLLVLLGGHNKTGFIKNSFQGKLCKAGKNYMVIGPTGDVWRCYQAKKEKKEFLGNIMQKNFKPFTEARPCPYNYCPCTVPIGRQMISAT